MRSTLRSMTDSAIVAVADGLDQRVAPRPGRAGHDEVLGARALSRLRTAVQSLITTPSKPHSRFSGVSSRSFSVTVTPLTEL